MTHIASHADHHHADHHHADHHHAMSGHAPASAHGGSLRRLAFMATLHCMTGCAIGEIAGLVIGTALGWGMWETIGLTMIPLIRHGMPFRKALGIAFAADFISVTVMEVVDNAVMMMIPGAMSAGLTNVLFWGSMAIALAVAFVAAFPVNLWLISRGKGHAVVHAHH